MSNREHLPVRSDHGVRGQAFSEAADDVFATRLAQAVSCGAVEEHDFRATVVVHDTPVREEVFEDLRPDAALLHAHSGVLGEFVGVHEA